MSIPVLSTKLYIPPLRPNVVARSRLVERLNEGMRGQLTLISASAGYGKTTLVSEWLAGCGRPVAWLSIDEGDNDPARFLTYLFAAVQTVLKNMEASAAGLLQAPELPPIETIVAALLNVIAAIPDRFVLVLDDYHVIEDETIGKAVALLLERMPPQMHLVVITRETPRLPLARLRVRDQLTEMRAADLRFTCSEAAEFLGRVMGLSLSSEDVALLEARTEGWIAGLQLAALSMQGHNDPAGFVQAFTGSHRFVLDYLVEEVLQRQTAAVQTFLLRTSVLDRLCGPLCDAVVGTGAGEGQATLEYLERANLFIVPLDHERRWYRYHHLFADLLRQRLRQSIASPSGNEERTVAELHIRASVWCEDNGLELEAFHHAAAAQDIRRAARLLEGKGMPLLFRGAVKPVTNWLGSLRSEELDAMPSLWVMYASALLMAGQMTGIEQKLRAAEQALQGAGQDDKTRDLVGHIAAIRATMAVSKHQAETIIAESRRALANLHPDNLPVRTAATWSLGYAYQLQGDYAAAGRAYAEALSISRKIGHIMIAIMASLGLGMILEADNQLYAAAETYRSVLELAGDPPLPAACEAHLGLARICYEWNDLGAAMQHGQQTVRLALQLEQTDRAVAGELLLARLKLAQGDVSGAAALIAKADHTARQQSFANQLPLIAEAQVLVLLRQGNLAAAADLAQKHGLHLSRARVYLAQGDASAALALLEPLGRQAEAKEHKAELLKLLVVKAAAYQAQGETQKAAQTLKHAQLMAEAGGFVRIFLDEGMPPSLQNESNPDQRPFHSAESLIEPLSERELEVLHLIAQGLSNRDISERLFLALSTVKGHNRNIFDKLQVQRRTEAVARARKLGLLQELPQ